MQCTSRHISVTMVTVWIHTCTWTTHDAHLQRFITWMKHATDIYCVYLWKLIVLFFPFQVYARVCLPKSRTEMKTPNHDYWITKCHSGILLVTFNTPFKKQKWRKLSYHVSMEAVVCILATVLHSVGMWMDVKTTSHPICTEDLISRKKSFESNIFQFSQYLHSVCSSGKYRKERDGVCGFHRLSTYSDKGPNSSVYCTSTYIVVTVKSICTKGWKWIRVQTWFRWLSSWTEDAVAEQVPELALSLEAKLL
jgi:hypothetical protein